MDKNTNPPHASLDALYAALGIFATVLASTGAITGMEVSTRVVQSIGGLAVCGAAFARPFVSPVRHFYADTTGVAIGAWMGVTAIAGAVLPISATALAFVGGLLAAIAASIRGGFFERPELEGSSEPESDSSVVVSLDSELESSVLTPVLDDDPAP